MKMTNAEINSILDGAINSAEGARLVRLVGKPHARLLLFLTGHLESNWTPGLTSSRGAKGVFQFLPSSIALYHKNRQLEPWQDDDVLLQARYALAHLVDNINTARLNQAYSFEFPQTAFGRDILIQRVRFHYVNGPSCVPKFPAEIEADQKRLAAFLDDLALQATNLRKVRY